jgi:DUF438 domain-containing protein
MENRNSEIFKELLSKLHNGESEEDVKKEFADKLGSLSQEELAAAEKELISSGTKPEEIQKMCDVHAEIYLSKHIACQGDCQTCQEEEIDPLTIMETENNGIKTGSEYLLSSLKGKIGDKEKDGIKKAIDYLNPISIHFSKKEDLFFPYLYRHGVSSIPQVMWGVDDEIRQGLKKAQMWSKEDKIEENREELIKTAEKINLMTVKENEILWPLVRKTLSQEELNSIEEEMPSLGFPFLKLTPQLQNLLKREEKGKIACSSESVDFPTGRLSIEELEGIMNSLTGELTFISKDRIFTYFNKVKDPIFIRTKAQLGDNVEFCHPVKALPLVRKILDDLETGKSSEVSFILKKGERNILNKYIAVKNPQGAYLGCLEISQDINPILEEAKEKKLI